MFVTPTPPGIWLWLIGLLLLVSAVTGPILVFAEWVALLRGSSEEAGGVGSVVLNSVFGLSQAWLLWLFLTRRRVFPGMFALITCVGLTIGLINYALLARSRDEAFVFLWGYMDMAIAGTVVIQLAIMAYLVLGRRPRLIFTR